MSKEYNQAISNTLKNILCALRVQGGDVSYNSLGQEYLEESGAVETYTFLPGEVHGIAWIVNTGSITISINGGTAISYDSAGAMGFSTTNADTITFTIVTGNANLQWNKQ